MYYKSEHFLVCGLGNLGQHCVKILHKFGVSIIVIAHNEELNIPEINDIIHIIDNLIIGDCRNPDILKQAKIKQCRAALLVTSDEQVNIETAFVINDIDSEIRLVINSSQTNINQNIKKKLNNCVAYNPNELPVEAIATRALGDENRGFIQLRKERLVVLKDKIDVEHKWCGSYLRNINTKNRIVLSHIQDKKAIPTAFYEWKDNARIGAGDEVAYIQIKTGLTDLLTKEVHPPKKQRRRSQKFLFKMKLSWNWKQLVEEVYVFLEWIKESIPEQLSKRMIWVLFLSWFILFIIGVAYLAFREQKPLWNSMYSTFVMLLGAYDGVFVDHDAKKIWIRLMNAFYMLAGLSFIGVMNAWLTQWWLNEKFDLLAANPIPKKDHIVIVGLGYQIGRPVAMFLHNKLHQSVVAVSRPVQESSVATQVQIVVGDSINTHKVLGDLPKALAIANINTAKGIVIITDDEKLNLEIGLMAIHEKNPNSTLIIRTLDTSFSNKIKTLFSTDKVKFLCVNDIAAKVFVATAFEKNVLNLLWLNDQMVLVTEYKVKPNDTFNARFLYEIINEYKIVPISYKKDQGNTKLMPLDNIKLKVGDCLVFLTTIESLIKIDQVQKNLEWD
ncbi:MAG: NAD-binding protein [Calothrix sp. C42_A2020_038]|nr:NAD-binding protein [Calothrix sp. C42_A2020_038]